MSTPPYIPGIPNPKGVLMRYLPPVWQGQAAGWLEKHIPKGKLILDPFGASPQMAVETAQAGYRVIVAANNPVTRFILELLADPPPQASFQSALAALASEHIGGERLEPHIKSLYTTACAKCGGTVEVKAFLWQADETVPYAKIYDCPQCGDSGERPASAADRENAAQFTGSSLHRARALERVAPLHDPDRVHAEEALEVYLPRAIYALLTIINKLSSLPREHLHHTLLSALLLSACDQANTLWAHPTERQRPRQLTIPPQFRENNIWIALESAIALWDIPESGTPLTRWPDLPPQDGGICLFDGRIKDLAENLSDIELSAIVSVIPRPNQAFWTLSALWAGWLWGREAAEPFKSVLRRRRYDWSWHATAIATALGFLAQELPQPIPFWGLVNELEPGFLAAAVLGAQSGGFDLGGIALREAAGQAQATWQNHKGNGQTAQSPQAQETVILDTCKQYLRKRGEPAAYIYLYAAGLTALAQHHTEETLQPGERLSNVQADFQHALSYRGGILRYGGSGKTLDSGQYWVQEPEDPISPLADRAEIAFVDHLLKNPESSSLDIDKAVCQELPGLFTPEPKLMQMCLESYGEGIPPESGIWSLREADSASKRRAEFVEMARLISEIGTRLGFRVIQETEAQTIQWDSANSHYRFFLSASAILEKFLIPYKEDPTFALIVHPGSRSNLIAYKLKSNPYLQQIVDKGWRFIKYRLVRQLAESPTLNGENLDELLALDPLTYTEPQLRLL